MKNVIVFGVSSAFKRLEEKFNYNKIKVVGIYDNNSAKWGQEIMGIKVGNPTYLNQYDYDYVLICSSYYEEIKKQVLDIGVDERKIINYYELVAGNNEGRTTIANNFIKYDEGYRHGIEIGAAHTPLCLIDVRVKVTQVDWTQHTAESYNGRAVVKVDILDNGETLEKIEDESEDFVIACHMLEHCRNPIGTIRNFLRVLRTGGLVFLAIPDKRYTFDYERELTTFEHLAEDDKALDWKRELEHFDWCGEVSLDEKKRKLEQDYSIHRHVWDANSFVRFLIKLQSYLGERFEIEQCGRIDNGDKSDEILIVIRKK